MPRYNRVGECRRWCGGNCCSIHGYYGTPEYEQIKAEFEKPPFFGLNAHGECNKLVYRHGMPTCSVYEDRPEICKTFPLHPRDLAGLPECGFSFVKKPDPIVKPSKPNPFVLMDWEEQWPLFGVKKHVFDTGQVYAEIMDLPPIKTSQGMVRGMEEIRRLEWKIWQGGLAGWIMATDKDNWKMQGAVVHWGGEYYAAGERVLWFKRPLTKAPRKPIPGLREVKAGIDTYIRTMRSAYAHG